MNSLSQYIIEKLRINKDTEVGQEYKYHPKDKDELIQLIKKLAKKRGINADLNDIDVSNIKDMSGLFLWVSNSRNYMDFNPDVSKWDVSNVTDMSDMFNCCFDFNCDISSWDVSNVTDMARMFGNCTAFNKEYLKNWKVSNDTNMEKMFYNNSKNLPSWYHE